MGRPIRISMEFFAASLFFSPEDNNFYTNMNCSIDEVNSRFASLISQRGVYKVICRSNDPVKLKRMYSLVNSIRQKVKKGEAVTIDFKIKWLILSGWRPGNEVVHTKTEVIYLIGKAIKLNKQARSMGPQFVYEQIKLSK